MADQKQTKADGGAADSKAPASADSDIDRLISEFDTAKAAGAESRVDLNQVKPLLDAIKPIATFAQAKMREERQTAEKESVGKAVSFVKAGDDLKDVPDRLVKGYLQDRYVEDNEFRTAYDNRAEKPSAWQSELEKAKTEFTTDIKSMTTTSLRSDVEAAKAAVKGAARPNTAETKEVESKKLFAMSDVEFRAYKQDLAADSRS